jgi:hypothetical protein
VADGTGNGSKPYLEGLFGRQLAANHEQEVGLIDGVIIDNLKRLDLI